MGLIHSCLLPNSLSLPESFIWTLACCGNISYLSVKPWATLSCYLPYVYAFVPMTYKQVICLIVNTAPYVRIALAEIAGVSVGIVLEFH